MELEQVIRMAQECHLIGMRPHLDGIYEEAIKRFAALVAAAAKAEEREECAKLCESESKRALWNWENDISGNKPFWNGAEQLTSGCAAAIRARGQQ